MIRSPFSTLRARLILLVIIAAIPVFGLTLYTGLTHRQQAITAAQEEALRVVQLASFYQARALDSARQLLITLSRVPEIQSDSPEACSAFLAELIQQYTAYTSFAVADLDGNVLCSALPLNEPTNIADRPYFPKVLATQDFAVGTYQIGRISGKPILSAGYPVFDSSNDVHGVVIAALDLSWFNQLVSEAHLPAQSVVTVIDHNGLILARFPDSELWVGKELPDEPLIRTLLANHEGTAELTDLDQVLRLYGYTTLNGGPDTAHVTVGIPTEIAYAKANQSLMQNLLGLGVVFLLVLAATGIIGERFVLRPVGVLVNAARQLSEGDFNVHIGQLQGPAEMQQLGLAFDEMAVSLQSRETALIEIHQYLQRYVTRLEALHSIDHAMLTTQSATETTKVALTRLTELVSYRNASIALLNLKTRKAKVIATSTVDSAPVAEGEEIDISLEAVQKELLQGEMRVVEDLAALPELTKGEQIMLERGVRASHLLPLMAQGELIGVLSLSRDQPGLFPSEDIEVAQEIAAQLAIAIQTARLYEQTKRHAEELEQRVTERTVDLQRAKEHVEGILANSSDAIILAHTDGVIQQVNPAFHRLFAVIGEELYHKPLSEFIHEESLAQFNAALEKVVFSRQSGRVEVMCRRRDSSFFDADLAIARLTQRDTNDLSVICSVRDISERKKLESDLRASLSKEHELNELRARFVSMLSHDFRTPMAVIQSSSGLLKDFSERLTEEKKRSHLEKIQFQIKRLVSMLDDMLILMKAQTVGVQFDPQVLDVVVLCQAITKDVQQTTTEHQIVFSRSENGGDALLDEKLLRQIITNLLSNAVKYSPDGGIINFDLHCENDEIILKIKDAGIGIPEADQANLFEAFQRARNVGDIGGTGLGLAIVKQAVDAHGGSITFESEIGVGTTFIVTLPSQL